MTSRCAENRNEPCPWPAGPRGGAHGPCLLTVPSLSPLLRPPALPLVLMCQARLVSGAGTQLNFLRVPAQLHSLISQFLVHMSPPEELFPDPSSKVHPWPLFITSLCLSFHRTIAICSLIFSCFSPCIYLSSVCPTRIYAPRERGHYLCCFLLHFQPRAALGP